MPPGCGHYGFRADYDVCEAASRRRADGHVDYCRDEGPCGVGEGDCDSTSDVRAGSSAAGMSGQATGSGRTTMCAQPPHVGGQNGHVDYCRDEGPCGVGEGDCDGHSQCESGLAVPPGCRGQLRVPGELRCVRVAQRGGEKGAALGASPGCVTKRTFAGTAPRRAMCAIYPAQESVSEILNVAGEKWDRAYPATR